MTLMKRPVYVPVLWLLVVLTAAAVAAVAA
jgi:hypothetical protein